MRLPGLFILAVLFPVYGCQVFRPVAVSNYTETFQLPGTIHVGNGLYVDYSEITNLDWREYLHWTENVFGKNSGEYLDALPDTSVWSDLEDPCWQSLSAEYFRQSTFNNSPVIGIDQEQAMTYSKWRSDRVFEFMLIDLKLLKYNPDQTPENYFTIERYYNGEIDYVRSEEKVPYFPEYRLPTSKEFQRAMYYADSIDEQYQDIRNSKKCADLAANINFFDSLGCPEGKHVEYAEAFHITPYCAYKMPHAVFRLKDNVQEWSLLPNVALGGSWRGKMEPEDHIVHVARPNAWTGFRNVCEWKAYSPAEE
jgi:hypothetical protein